MPRKKRSKKSKSGLDTLVRILAILGALITILYGVLAIIGGALSILVFNIGGVPALIQGVVIIFIGLIILASYGFIKINLSTTMHWLVLLILGIVAYVFGGGIGALLIILAGIVDIFRKIT